MHAVLRMNVFDPVKLAASGGALAEFDEIHAAQPGYVGSITVDLGENRQFVVNLWESEEDSVAALSVLGPEVGRLVAPLTAQASDCIGAGTVATDLDLARASETSDEQEAMWD